MSLFHSRAKILKDTNSIRNKITDINVFTDAYLIAKEDLLFLEDQINEFTDSLLNVSDRNWIPPGGILIKGYPGTGKTSFVNVMLKEFQKYLVDIQKKIYVCHCSNPQTKFGVLSKFAGDVGLKIPGNFSFEKVVNRYKQHLGNDTISIWVIDDINNLPQKDLESIIYLTSRYRHNEFPPVCLIILTTNFQFTSELGGDAKNSYYPKEIEIGYYDQNQLYEIYSKRCQIANIRENISDESLQLIAKIAEENNSSCRLGLINIYYSIDNSFDKQFISNESIEIGRQKAFQDLNMEKLQQLKQNHRLILFIHLFFSKFYDSFYKKNVSHPGSIYTIGNLLKDYHENTLRLALNTLLDTHIMIEEKRSFGREGNEYYIYLTLEEDLTKNNLLKFNDIQGLIQQILINKAKKSRLLEFLKENDKLSKNVEVLNNFNFLTI